MTIKTCNSQHFIDDQVHSGLAVPLSFKHAVQISKQRVMGKQHDVCKIALIIPNHTLFWAIKPIINHKPSLLTHNHHIIALLENVLLHWAKPKSHCGVDLKNHVFDRGDSKHQITWLVNVSDIDLEGLEGNYYWKYEDANNINCSAWGFLLADCEPCQGAWKFCRVSHP